MASPCGLSFLTTWRPPQSHTYHLVAQGSRGEGPASLPLLTELWKSCGIMSTVFFHRRNVKASCSKVHWVEGCRSHLWKALSLVFLSPCPNHRPAAQVALSRPPMPSSLLDQWWGRSSTGPLVSWASQYGGGLRTSAFLTMAALRGTFRVNWSSEGHWLHEGSQTA